MALAVSKDMWGRLGERVENRNLHCILLGTQLARAQFLKSNDTVVKCVLCFPSGKIYMNMAARVLINLINIYVVLLYAKL